MATVDSPGICNETIYLEEGAKSAAILRLTDKDSYAFSPMNCIITFKASKHSWSGLTGVLEEVDLRRYESNGDHHLDQSQCIDYIKIQSSGDSSGMPKDEQCGSWSVSPAENLSHIGFRRSLFGYCPNPPAPSSIIRCGVSELKVLVSVGQRDYSSLRRGKPWRSHRGFTFVVTAYRYSFGEKGCTDGLQSCGKMDYHGYQHHCVHKSLWCDHHINCGQPRNNDELSCHSDEMLSGLVTVMVGPWVGAALLIFLVVSAVVYWRRAIPFPSLRIPQPQDHNSYAESYEVSSTMSSAHHMAIQVRVVCNSAHGIHTPRTSPWQASDLPPSYESLFPQGPPPQKTALTTNTTSTTTATSAASFNISTTSLVSVPIGSNANATSGPSGFYSNTTQTSSIVIPISAICNNLGNSSAMSSASFSTTTFTNTVSSAMPSATNTTTSTTTIASVGASPSTLASISVTSVSLAGASRDVKSGSSKDNTHMRSHHHSNETCNINNVPSPITCCKTGRVGTRPPLVEPEDTNISPCNSTSNTPASADVQLPYSFHDGSLSNTETETDHRESHPKQSSNRTAAVASRQESTLEDTEPVLISNGAVSLGGRSSEPHNEQEYTTQGSENAEGEESCIEFKSAQIYYDSERVNKDSEITPFHEIKDDEDTLERSSENSDDLDRDNESLL
ncbi:hypothetical protein SK128_027147 [Halocaridina rubra]|uniref:Uncharacterized protein n=1 Tax=Halocaridina rubra TaxID=373956 RepID=A0AAN9A953_HALRR